MGNSSTKSDFPIGTVSNSEGDDSNYSNPLENPLIVTVVSKHIEKAEDLQNFRLVNRLWNDISLERWRLSATLRIHTVKKSENFGWKMFGTNGNEDGVNLEELFQTPSETGTKEMSTQFSYMPFRRHNFPDYLCLPLTLENENEMLYWELYGTHLKYLQLSQVFFPEGKEVEGLSWIIINCPNLVELVLSAYGTRDSKASDENVLEREYNEVLPIASALRTVKFIKGPTPLLFKGWNCKRLFNSSALNCRKFLSMVPNLKELVIHSDSHSILEALGHPSPTTGDFITLETLLIHSQLDDLIPLKLYFEVTSPSMIKSLKLCISEVLCRTLTFRWAFPLIEESLQSLTLDIKIDSNAPPPYFGALREFYFHNLTSLQINCVYSSADCKYVPFDFRTLRHTPKLQKFKYLQTGATTAIWNTQEITLNDLNGGLGWYLTEKGNQFELGNALMLETMKQFSFNRRFNQKAIDLLKQWFPNSTVFKFPSVIPGLKLFNALCEYSPEKLLFNQLNGS